MAKTRRSEDPKVRATAARFYVEVLSELNRIFKDSERTGLTKADVARILGVHRSTVIKMLSGERGNITLGTVGALAGAMNHYPDFVLKSYDGVEGNGENVALETNVMLFPTSTPEMSTHIDRDVDDVGVMTTSIAPARWAK